MTRSLCVAVAAADSALACGFFSIRKVSALRAAGAHFTLIQTAAECDQVQIVIFVQKFPHYNVYYVVVATVPDISANRAVTEAVTAGFSSLDSRFSETVSVEVWCLRVASAQINSGLSGLAVSRPRANFCGVGVRQHRSRFCPKEECMITTPRL